MTAIVNQFFILHAPVIIAAAVITLHILGYLAEKYLSAGSSPAVWAGVAIIDAAFAYKCGQLVQTAFRDSLTQLNNRHYLAAAIGERLAKLKKSGADVSLLMIDIDNFKQINDSHGHGAGDAVLRQVAALLKANIRKDDFAIRWGGEEFLIVLAGLDRDNACRFADRLRAAVESSRFGVGADGLAAAVTISVGVASAPAGADLATLTDLADEALYKAKQTKNIVAAK